MKKIILFFFIFIIPLAVIADENTDKVFEQARLDIQRLMELPISAHVDTSPYNKVPNAFNYAMFTFDEDAPYLFINDIQFCQVSLMTKWT